MNRIRLHALASKIYLAAIFACVLLLPSLAHATERRDVMVGLKTLSMLSEAPKGSVTMAVVFDPANAASKADADSIISMLASMQTPDGLKLSGVLVPVSDLGKLSHARVAFVTEGLQSYFGAIAAAAASANVLTMSTDLQCVRENKCILGIHSEPEVDIFYSRAAGEATKIDFDPAFTMLVKKV